MNIERQWCLATIRRDDGEVLARFAYQHRDVLNDSSYSRSAWLQLDATSALNLDDYLHDLDEIEDVVKREMEECSGCQMLLALSGAGYRDLIFAIRDDAKVDEAIQIIASQHADRLEVRVFESPKFGPFAALIAHVKGQS